MAFYQNLPLKWLYLDFNSYFATIEQQIEPKLRNKPIAVVPTMTNFTCAIAASYEAKSYGIKTGTMIYEAKRLCPNLICVLANHESYVTYHHKLLSEINKYLPIEIVSSIDEVACELTHKQRIEKNAITIALNIKNGISKNIGDYIKCSIGISSNRFLAKTASNLEKPDGLQVLYPSDIPHKIIDLQLSDLTGIGKRMEKRLHTAKIKTITDLYKLSPKNMRNIWGSVIGEDFWYLIRGKEIEYKKNKRRTIGHSHVLHPEWRNLMKARQVLYRLVTKAASRLRRTKYCTTKLFILIKTKQNKYLMAKTKFSETYDNFTLLEETNILWNHLVNRHKCSGIKKISITLSGLKEKNSSQLSLFDNINETKQSIKKINLSNAMDRINAKFGRDSIVIGSIPNKIIFFSGTKIAFTRIPDKKEFYE